VVVVTTGLDIEAESDPETAFEPEVDPVVTIGFACAAAPATEPEVAPESDADVAWDKAAVPDIVDMIAATARSFFIDAHPNLNPREGRGSGAPPISHRSTAQKPLFALPLPEPVPNWTPPPKPKPLPRETLLPEVVPPLPLAVETL
jgi:hypothetical protein